MSRPDIFSLLERYASGTTSAAENLRVENWLAEHQNPDNQWARMDAAGREQWLGQVFADVESTIEKNTSVITMRPRRRLWWAAAAAALLLVGFSLLWPRDAPLTAMRTTAYQKKEVLLSDGSKIWLNATSELKYPEKFSGTTREVFLKGEAYFDIKHDDHHAFIVHTGEVVTTVLGTAFDIKEDKINHIVQVTVTRGKVSVADGKKQLGIITPNQQISFNVLNSKSVQTEVNADQALAWQKTELHFEDITFAEAALQLQQRFNVKINFSNGKIKDCRFTGTALKGEKLDKILKVICAFNHATYQTKPDGNIIIDGAGCN
jgi:transmembrane sensor